MSSHKKFTVEDFKGIQVKENWTAFDVLVAICSQVKKKRYNVNNARDLGSNKLSWRKRSIRETEKKKESRNNEQERPIKRLRFFNRPQETEKQEEIIQKPAATVSMPVQVPQLNKKNLSKVKKEELARILAQDYDLPDEFREKIKSMNQTGEAKLVIQKLLFEADIRTGLNRFSIPCNQLRCTNFLTEEEKSIIVERTIDNHLRSIAVRVIEPGEGLPVGEANFTKWDMKKTDGKVSQSYVLNGGWKDIRSRNRLATGMFMQLWAFRDADEALCFALVKVPNDLKKCSNLN